MKKLISFVAVAAIAASATGYSAHHEEGEQMHSEMTMALPDIVDTASAAGSFATLVAAVQAAGLVDTLKGEGPFTVFAPTDEAFAALPEGTIESLLQADNKDQLVSILTYHVVSGKVMSADIAGKELMVETVQGSKIEVDATSGVKVDDANVVTADVEASNGVIHVIDKVIMPAD